MSFAVRRAWDTDLDRLIELAVECQRDPNRCCDFLSSDSAALRIELQQIDGPDVWTDATWVALDDDRRLLGWIAADFDESMGRVWWLGPFIADADAPLADAVADGLMSAGRRDRAAFAEHELAADARSTFLARCAERNGFRCEEASVALRLDDLHLEAGRSSVVIAPADSDDVGAIELHDALFPGTHATGAYLFEHAGDRHDRYVARLDGGVVGYVATELQHDGALYIDFLGVADACRGRGVGRALVSTAVRARAAEATYAHLTVRTSNGAARRLYASLGFVEDRVLVPYRIGFTIA